MQTPVKTNTQTPCKECMTRYRSNEKENLGERLYTEKVKLTTGRGVGGLEINKAKSTMLVKDKRTQLDKGQVFTARKMKLEIENIISRRNRQVRNDSRLLK